MASEVRQLSSCFSPSLPALRSESQKQRKAGHGGEALQNPSLLPLDEPIRSRRGRNTPIRRFCSSRPLGPKNPPTSRHVTSAQLGKRKMPFFLQRFAGHFWGLLRQAFIHVASTISAWAAGLLYSADDEIRRLGLSGPLVIEPHFILTWEGWGTSLCWWAHFLGGRPQADYDKILDLFFDPKIGLGLNIVRYNIGGGPPPSVKENITFKVPSEFKAIPGFKESEAVPYDWSSDENQRKILLAARTRGVNIVEAFSNSPPHWMTITGSCTGGWNFGAENLKNEYFTLFADYLTEVVKYYRDNFGIIFQFLEPFNEPDEGWWVVGGSQEGCNFSPGSMDKILPLVAKSLTEKGLETKISGVDSWVQNTPRIFAAFSPETVSVIRQINVHGYYTFSPDSSSRGEKRRNAFFRKKMRELAAGMKKSLWQSEAGPMNLGGQSELKVALQIALNVTMDINQMHARAWIYWQALEVPSGNYWGLIKAPFSRSEPFSFSIQKQFYVLMHFSRWVRAGSKILKVPVALDDHVLAAFDPEKSILVIVVTNISQESPLAPTLQLRGFGSTPDGAKVKVNAFCTSATANYSPVQPAADVCPLPGALQVNCPKEAIMTYVLHDVRLLE